RLVNGIIRYVHKVADARDIPLTLDPYTGTRLERESRDTSLEISPGNISSPVFWGTIVVAAPVLVSLLVMIPFVMLDMDLLLVAVPAVIGEILFVILFIYMLHRWTKDMVSHDTRWGRFAGATGIALHRLGYDVRRLPGRRRLQERNTAVYVLMSIHFSMIFIPIWLYFLIDDQNQHLRWQRTFEQSFLNLIEPGSRR
ncbi:MAG: hypothetical protein MUO94_07630, partial [Thermoplasmata archaeon]|nr:hypothetical protein [Thermoplasmata archaeon]